MATCCSTERLLQQPPPVLGCPSCGAPAKRVGAVTVKSLVRHLSFGAPATQYYFCESPRCPVVYFPLDREAPVFGESELLVPVGLKRKDADAPVCYCFGITRGQIEREVALTGQSAIPARIKAEVQVGACACEVKNPSGKCCLGQVQRVLQESRAALENSQGRPSVQSVAAGASSKPQG